MKYVVAVLAAVLVCATPAQAQKTYSQPELDSLLAPVALQADGLLSQILMAATYPGDVAAAAAWSRANPQLRGDQATRAVQDQPWDPSVKALVAFPDLLARMGESPQWLYDLGQAFLQQESQVMDTVQGLRHRAQTNGNLTSNDQQAVVQQGDAIVVQPRTQIVYVPYYDPYVVYGTWWWPYYRPVFWRPWAPRPVFVSAGFFYSSCDWGSHFVRVVHRPAGVAVVTQHPHVVPGKWQHRPTNVAGAAAAGASAKSFRGSAPQHQWGGREFNRVPESQRKPIVQSFTPPPHSQQSMPAANGYSRPQQQQAQPRREMRYQQQPRMQTNRPQWSRGEQRGQQEQRGRRG
jgi:hypothetical protein